MERLRHLALTGIVALSVCMAATAVSGQDDEVVVLDDDDIEVLDDDDIEVLDEGEVDVGGEDGSRSGPLRLLGRFHPPIVHFAVAWSVLAFPFALARLRWKNLGKTDFVIVSISVAAASGAVVTGMLHAPEVMQRPGIRDLVELHEHAGQAVLGLLVAALVLRVIIQRRETRAVMFAYLALLAVVFGVVLWVGHLGGAITFGEGFLF